MTDESSQIPSLSGAYERIRISSEDFTLEASVPSNKKKEAYQELFQVECSIIKGNFIVINSLDAPPRGLISKLSYYLDRLKCRLDQKFRVLWRATIARKRTMAEIESLRETFRREGHDV